MTVLLKRLFSARTRVRVRLALFRLRGLWWRGRTVACPCCGGHFRRFLPFGEGARHRPHAECPACHALERTRLLWLWLDRETHTLRDLAPPGGGPVRVLHVAPEPALERRLRRLPHVAYRSADLSWPLAMDRVDLQAMPYADGAFDLALCSHVLAHVEDDRRALAELFRVLRPGGVLVLQSLIDDALATTHEDASATTPAARTAAFGQDDRFRSYGRDHDARVAAAGFRVESLDYAATFPADERTRLGLDGAGLLHVATRPA